MENEWQVPLIPQGMCTIKIMDILLVGSIWARRAKVLLGMVSKLTLLYSHILQCTTLPLCCDTLRSLLERKLQNTICFEYSIQINEMKYGVQSVLDDKYM